MFKKYHSIENTYRTEFLEKIKTHGFWEEEFIVQEKVHGSNLSFWTTDGENFHAAKRTSVIEEDEVFYNYALVLEEVLPKLKQIWLELHEKYPKMEQMTVFGEIIGGSYPHKSVERNKSAIRVQKGIFYSPNNVFFAFDILLDAENYIDIDEATVMFEKYGFLYAKTLFRGSLEVALEYPNVFESTVPELLGLPLLEKNICEGVVIKPMKSLFFNNGSRVILKNKNERWSENTKFNKSINQEDDISEKVLKLQEAIQAYVTENRLNNVLSKIGIVAKNDFGRVMGLFSADVIEDFMKDHHKIMEDLDKKETKLVTKSITKAMSELVKEALLE